MSVNTKLPWTVTMREQIVYKREIKSWHSNRVDYTWAARNEVRQISCHTTLSIAVKKALLIRKQNSLGIRDHYVTVGVRKHNKAGQVTILPWGAVVWVPLNETGGIRIDTIKTIDLNWGILRQWTDAKRTFDAFLASVSGGSITPDLYMECTGKDLINDIKKHLKNDNRIIVPHFIQYELPFKTEV